MIRPSGCWFVLAVLLLTGCGTLPNGRGWGRDAALFPGGQRIRNSFVKTVRDPLTWAPLVGAAALQIDNADDSISDWASEHTPIFGSTDKAENFRDYSGPAADFSYWITALATPSGDSASEWIPAKLKGVAVGGSAQFLSFQSSDLIKDTTGRTRPNEENDKSLPSEHATRMGVNTTLASRNLDSLPVSESTRTVSRIGLGTIAALGSWSRVEAGAHFPSDVLVGLSLGHFFGAFLNDAFLGLDQNTAEVAVTILDGRAVVLFAAGF